MTIILGGEWIKQDQLTREYEMSEGSGFDFLEQLKECQAINLQVTERLDSLVEGVQAGTAGVAIWSLDKLESDCRDLTKRFQKIAAVLRVS